MRRRDERSEEREESARIGVREESEKENIWREEC